MDHEAPFMKFLGRASQLVDGLLRGSRGTDPARPPEARVHLRDALIVALPLAAFYGLCMGLAAGPGMAVLVAIKIPLILLLSSLICFPSFYVFSALTGTPLGAVDAARSLGAFSLLTGVVWAALAPVTGFFTLSTDPTSEFIATLHGLVLGLGIVIGLVFLGRELTRRKLLPTAPPPVPSKDPDSEPQAISSTSPAVPTPTPRERYAGDVPLGFFLIWVIVFAFVACQLFADFAPYLESGPFLQTEPRFFLEGLGSTPGGR
jgi:hypothetical protein